MDKLSTALALDKGTTAAVNTVLALVACELAENMGNTALVTIGDGVKGEAFSRTSITALQNSGE